MTPGFHLDFPTADYLRDPCPAPSLTQSIAKVIIDRSPHHAWTAHPRLNPDFELKTPEQYNAARAIGDAAHLKLLGRGKQIAMIGADDFRTKEAQKLRDDALAAGKSPILLKHQRTVNRMVGVAQDRLAELGLADDFKPSAGNSEVVLAWQEGDLWFRSLVDRLPHHRRRIIDYKTTGRNAAPHAIAMMMVDAGWDVQAAMHERGLDALDPDNAGRREHICMVQENEEPFAITVCRLSESVMTMGRKKLAVAVTIWADCMISGMWPGYPAQIIEPMYPGYREQQWLTREIEDDERRKSNGNYGIGPGYAAVRALGITGAG